MLLRVRPGTDEKQRQAIVEAGIASSSRSRPALDRKWEPLIGVKVERFFVQRMKTKWGSCNPGTAGIRLNTELAKKPPECLEYIVVHEMVHLLEPTHNARFVALMDHFMPKWRLSGSAQPPARAARELGILTRLRGHNEGCLLRSIRAQESVLSPP